MHHFFLSPDDIHDLQVIFPAQVSHQIKHVLRLATGDRVAVLDNCGSIYTVVLRNETAGGQRVGDIVSTQMATSEPQVQISLFIGLSSREKMEWIFQKGTEIGVSAFCPFVSTRTLVSNTGLTEGKMSRWKRIIQEAAEQSGRGKLPVLNAPGKLADCFRNATQTNGLCLLALEGLPEDGANLKEALRGFTGDKLALFVGPEGGFSDAEVASAQGAGCQVVTLGARIFRMETAAIVFPALALHELGHV